MAHTIPSTIAAPIWCYNFYEEIRKAGDKNILYLYPLLKKQFDGSTPSTNEQVNPLNRFEGPNEERLHIQFDAYTMLIPVLLYQVPSVVLDESLVRENKQAIVWEIEKVLQAVAQAGLVELRISSFSQLLQAFVGNGAITRSEMVENLQPIVEPQADDVVHWHRYGTQMAAARYYQLENMLQNAIVTRLDADWAKLDATNIPNMNDWMKFAYRRMLMELKKANEQESGQPTGIVPSTGNPESRGCCAIL